VNCLPRDRILARDRFEPLGRSRCMIFNARKKEIFPISFVALTRLRNVAQPLFLPNTMKTLWFFRFPKGVQSCAPFFCLAADHDIGFFGWGPGCASLRTLFLSKQTAWRSYIPRQYHLKRLPRVCKFAHPFILSQSDLRGCATLRHLFFCRQVFVCTSPNCLNALSRVCNVAHSFLFA